MIDIDPFDFTPDGHTLTVTFTDVRGNVGITRYNFTGQTRERECICLSGYPRDDRTVCL